MLLLVLYAEVGSQSIEGKDSGIYCIFGEENSSLYRGINTNVNLKIVSSYYKNKDIFLYNYLLHWILIQIFYDIYIKWTALC